MSVQPNNQTNYWRKTPRITVVTPTRRKPELGEITQRFFAEGEEQAANGYKNLGYNLGVDDEKSDPVATRDRELEFDSFDEVPKRPRPLVGIALIVSGLAVMVAAWTVSTMGVPWQSGPYRNVAAPPTAATAAAIPAPASQTAVIEPIRAEPRAVTVATRVTPRVLAAAAVTRAVPRAAPGGDSDDLGPKPGPNGADDPDRNSDVRASHRSRPMRGYVWSPAAKAMVASETSGAVAAARGAEPDAVPAAAGTARPTAAATTAPGSTTAASTPAIAPAPGPGTMPAAPRIAPADTGPPPFESARVPIPAQSAPIIE